MKRVRFLEHVMGLDASEACRLEGEVVDIPDDLYEDLARQRTRNGGPWIIDAPDTPAVECRWCHRTFTESTLAAHMRFFHLGRTPQKEKKTSAHPRREEKLEGGSGEYVCRAPYCNRRFETPRARGSHEGQTGHRKQQPRIIAEEGDYACRAPGCERSFTSDHGRKTHEGRMHNQIYEPEREMRSGTGPP